MSNEVEAKQYTYWFRRPVLAPLSRGRVVLISAALLSLLVSRFKVAFPVGGTGFGFEGTGFSGFA